MTYVGPIIHNVTLFFIMMVPGIIMKKKNMVTDTFGKCLSGLVLYIAQPALIFLAYLRDFDMNILVNSVWVFLLSVIIHSLFSAVAMISFRRAPESVSRMLKFATVFSNAAFMGIPLIRAVLEPSFPGATMYASIYNITFNLFLWSLGVYICTSGRDGNREERIGSAERRRARVKSILSVTAKVLIHPVTLAAALGLIFFILPINSYVPAIVVESLTMLQSLVAPLSMLIIGIRLAEMNIRDIFRDKHMYLFLALRHILLPLAVILIVKILPLIGLNIHESVGMVSVILASTPAASSVTMFAERYDCDAQYASRAVVTSTLLSVITMPLMFMLL